MFSGYKVSGSLFSFQLLYSCITFCYGCNSLLLTSTAPINLNSYGYCGLIISRDIRTRYKWWCPSCWSATTLLRAFPNPGCWFWVSLVISLQHFLTIRSMISDQAINHIFDVVVEVFSILRILIGIQNEGVV